MKLSTRVSLAVGALIVAVVAVQSVSVVWTVKPQAERDARTLLKFQAQTLAHNLETLLTNSINDIAGETALIAESTSRYGEELKDLAAKLHGEINRFRF